MSEPFIGEIKLVGFNFPPRGWALCDGAILPISQNTALFSLLGTTFGGDGRTTFQLPDLRSRTALHVGNPGGRSSTSWGQTGGTENVTLTTNQMPPHTHTHTVPCNSGEGDTDSPVNNFPAVLDREDTYHTGKDAVMGSDPIGSTGGGQSFSIKNPFLGVYHVIALQGTFPSRS